MARKKRRCVVRCCNVCGTGNIVRSLSLSLPPKKDGGHPNPPPKLIWKEGRFLQNQFLQYVFFCSYIQWLCSKGGCKMFWWFSNQQELYFRTFCRTTGQTGRRLENDCRGNHHSALGLQIISNPIDVIYLLEVWHSTWQFTIPERN